MNTESAGNTVAYTEGYSAGFERAQADSVRLALEAQLKAREFIDASDQQILGVALACTEHMVRELGPAAVITAMLTNALRAVKARRRLRVSVGQDAANATRELLFQWQQEHPQVVVDVWVHSRVGPFDCKIESELGCIELGLRQQLETMRQVLSAGMSIREAAP